MRLRVFLLVFLSNFFAKTNAQDLDWGDFENNISYWKTWGGITTIINNPYPNIHASGKVLQYMPDSLWRGISIYFNTPPLNPSHKKISFDLYAVDSTSIQLGFPTNNYFDALFVRQFISRQRWTHLEFDISSLKTYNYKYFILQTAEKTTYYFDNIKVIADSLSNKIKLNNETKIVLFPNPVKDYFMLSNLPSPSILYIRNYLGQMMFQKEAINFEKINISNLQRGSYFIILENKEGILSSIKFIKE